MTTQPSPTPYGGLKFMNSYRLDSKKPFRPDKVHHILEELLTESLSSATYDATECAKRCVQLAGDIRARIKEQGYDRFKIIVKVDIGQKLGQGACSAATFLWDAERDNYTYFTFENLSLFAVACVFGVYYD